MRISLFLFFACIFQVFATNDYAQTRKISVSMENATIAEVLQSIEDQSEFRFFYNNQLVDITKLVDIDISNKNIWEVLESVLQHSGITYRVVGKQIALFQEDADMEQLFFQQQLVTGRVTDENGEPLPGVNITIKGTTTGTLSDLNGKYSINISAPGSILVFSFIGYESKEIAFSGQPVIDLQMLPEMSALEEVVVIGYGTAKRSDLTGSLSSVRSDEISAFPTTTISQALQGRASGVHVIQNTGKPGTAMQIRIRGTNSVRGDNNPLWIIDGFPGDESILSPSDIERIEVLKDASATAIYGSRGANGVILVTTKHGRAGTTRVDYDGRFSLQTVRKKLDLCDAKEFMLLQNIQQLNDMGAEYFSQTEITSAGKGTDWQDEMFRYAPVQDHSLTVSGGNEKAQFLVGGSYFDPKGIFINDDGYKRISLRANVNHDISKKFNIAYNAILSRIDTDNKCNPSGYTGLIAGLIAAPPSLSPYEGMGILC